MIKSQNLSNSQIKIRPSRLSSASMKKSSCGQTPSIMSSIISSNYARYLSHMSFDEEFYEENQKTQYWDLTYKCLLYVKREQQNLNTDLHDELLGHAFSHNFDMSKIDPTPLNSLGRWLMKNGYFLAAYAINKSRQRKSDFILKYYRRFYKHLVVEIGKREMSVYIGSIEEELNVQSQADLRKRDCIVRRTLPRNQEDTKSSI